MTSRLPKLIAFDLEYDVFTTKKEYPDLVLPPTSSKITHFKKLHEKTGIPYSEMNGVDDRTFEGGLNEWRNRHPVEVIEDAGGSATQSGS
ncbi:hypothetical protein PHLCEN_2v7860 [Hermanssonia centrifuga]|uniref:Uncharacterized protein n=1 Tax=Hermanssonia centrifuga TaxID=98765 RepID=A0A2R6NV78_9APHY|nr:hypothetical protein PHLCEN_2v7860 [Hermanssonia centrifuga]